MSGPGVLNPGQDGAVLRRFRLWLVCFRLVGHDALTGYGLEQIVLHACPSILSHLDDPLYTTRFVEICQGALPDLPSAFCAAGR